MAEQTSVKFFTYDMLRMPSVVPNNLSSIRDLLRFCLVNGSPEVAVTSATVTAGVCRMTVAAGNSFSFQSVVLCSGFDQAGANGEHRVTSTSDLWFEFKTDLPDGPLSGTAMNAKYAPAGWMEPFAADSTTMVIRSKNTNPESRRYFLQIKETTYQYIQVRAFKTMTDLNNGLIPIPTTAQNPNGYYWAKSAENNASPRAWFIIASDKFFYYGINHYYSLTIDRVVFMGCFGDFVTDNVNDKYNVGCVVVTPLMKHQVTLSVVMNSVVVILHHIQLLAFLDHPVLEITLYLVCFMPMFLIGITLMVYLEQTNLG